MTRTAASQQEGLRLDTRLGPLCVEFAHSPHFFYLVGQATWRKTDKIVFLK